MQEYCGLKFFVLSSWKLEHSITKYVSLSLLYISHNIPTPIFPIEIAFLPESFNILVINEVVVVFPFVPVIATILISSKILCANSKSLTTSIFNSFAFNITGLSILIPGLFKIVSYLSIVSIVSI